MLSDAERRVLAQHCHGHAVAACEDCRRDFKFTELGVDIVGRRYYFCPSCRLDLVDHLRLHVLNCRSIAASLEERVERSQQLIKDSDRSSPRKARNGRGVFSSAVCRPGRIGLPRRNFR